MVTLVSYCFDPALLLNIGMWDSYVVTKSRQMGFLRVFLHEDYRNSNIGENENDLFKLYKLFHKINIVWFFFKNHTNISPIKTNKKVKADRQTSSSIPYIGE